MKPGPLVRSVPGGIEIEVVVSAGSKRSGVSGTYGTALKVAVRAAPERGRANAEVVEVLAEHAGIGLKDVEIVSGHGVRRKRVRLRGITSI